MPEKTEYRIALEEEAKELGVFNGRLGDKKLKEAIDVAKNETNSEEEKELDTGSEHDDSESVLGSHSTIKMVREDGKEADVHPDMVDEYAKGGYVKK